MEQATCAIHFFQIHLVNVESIFWPSPIRIRLLPYFNDFHRVMGNWTSSGVDGGGDCRSETIMIANHLVSSLHNKEEIGKVEDMLFAHNKNLI